MRNKRYGGHVLRGIGFLLIAIGYSGSYKEYLNNYKSHKSKENLLELIGISLIIVGTFVLGICYIFGE